VLETPRHFRTRSRWFCDQCDGNYFEQPDQIGTVTVEWHLLYWQTICVPCAGRLGVTGCPTLLGTRTPPPDWPYPTPTEEMVFDWLTNGGRRFPQERPLNRLDIADEVRRIAESWA
jgi:hypothetical protein